MARRVFQLSNTAAMAPQSWSSGSLGKLPPRLRPHVLLEPPDDGLHLLDRQVDIALDAAALLVLFQDLLERLLREIEHHAAVHLDEAAVGVPREARVAAQAGEPLHGHIVQAQVQDRLHHPRHRHRGAGADRHQQRVVAVAQVLTGGALQPLEGVLHLGLQPLGELVALEIVQAEIAGDGEAGRDRNADGGHLGEAGSLAAEHVLHGGGAVGPALAEEIDQRLGVGPAHAGVAMSGVACRSCTRSSGVMVGYLPEKQAWQNPVSLPGRASACRPARDSPASPPRGTAGSPRSSGWPRSAPPASACRCRSGTAR